MKNLVKVKIALAFFVSIVVCTGVVFGFKEFGVSPTTVSGKVFATKVINSVYKSQAKERYAPFYQYQVYFKDKSGSVRKAGSLLQVSEGDMVCIEAIEKEGSIVGYRVISKQGCI
ncbi:hypothetical protein L1D40_05615 [Shewanella insulae]|uniref:hypothetical protein n=1 Tax=Shewanella insulae TaxID=2681496 RepID=UPI001EFD560A|nr:hypothetical protein [Shewanella insulae]MCG9754709.1 hypothetical protein [Shewanella insulae]